MATRIKKTVKRLPDKSIKDFSPKMQNQSLHHHYFKTILSKNGLTNHPVISQPNVSYAHSFRFITNMNYKEPTYV